MRWSVLKRGIGVGNVCVCVCVLDQLGRRQEAAGQRAAGAEGQHHTAKDGWVVRTHCADAITM